MRYVLLRAGQNKIFAVYKRTSCKQENSGLPRAGTARGPGRMRYLAFILLAAAASVSAQAAHTQAQLVLEADAARPGETVLAGVHLRMDKGWHTYWRNSGGSGMPTTIDWKLPKGVTAGAIQWPTPQKLPV